jgi:two-component system cell cycle sensor histidine kinase/response regulator CckA
MGAKQVRILLIEEDEAHAESIRRAFANHAAEYDVVVAGDLKRAKAYLRQSTPDLVISDLRLPDGTATDLLAVGDDGSCLPLVVMTAFGDEAVAEEVIKAGALDYVVKSDESLAHIPCIAERALREWSLIKERQRAEAALRESEANYRQIVENIPIMICEIDLADLRLTKANDATREVLGYSEAELLSLKPLDLITDEFRKEALECLNRITSGQKVPNTVEYKLRTRNGLGIWVLLNSRVIYENDKPARVLAVAQDISERKQLQTRLLNAQKMEAIGTLAGGIAHDFNNLLMGIQGRTSLLLADMDPSHPHCEHLKGIEDYIRSAADLTKQLLGFARGGKYVVKPIDLNEVIIRTADMFGRTRKEITIHRKCQKDIWTVEVDRGQLEQALLNLLVNSWQAMPQGGEIFLETRNLVLEKDDLKSLQLTPGKYVKLTVEDTGVGIDHNTQARIFEPFFTTKEIGKGMGLGLASVYGIIKNHNGIINVYSEPGEGTTFSIYLPASDKPVESQRSLNSPMQTGNEVVLLIDDEDMIITVGEQLLLKLGYQVLAARSGRQAIEIFRENLGQIQLVILDLIMPDLGGAEVFDRLKEMDPGIKVILSSGYSIDGIAKGVLERGCNGFIQKPFGLGDLSRKIRDILGKDLA